MSEVWSIRLAERRDLGALLSIENDQFPEPWTRGMLLDELSDTQTRRYTVAHERGDIVGYLGVMFVLDELHINTLGTKPGFEGRGVATSLLDDAWRDANERGIVRATLEMVPRKVAEAFAVFPIMFEAASGALSVVTCDPCDADLLREIQLASGAREIRLVPFFLGVGRHLREDLPRLLEQLRGLHPGVSVSLRQALGDEQFQTDWDLGRSLPEHRAIALAAGAAGACPPR